MKRRAAWTVLALVIASAGAYAIAWLVATRREMNQLGARIPSPWLLAVPIAALYWLWCWAEGLAHVTAGRISAGVGFVAALTPIGIAVLQRELNALETGPARSARWYRPARSPHRP